MVLYNLDIIMDKTTSHTLSFCLGAALVLGAWVVDTSLRELSTTVDKPKTIENIVVFVGNKPLECVLFPAFSGTKTPSCDWAKFNDTKNQCEAASLKRRTIKPNEQFPNGSFFPQIKGEC